MVAWIPKLKIRIPALVLLCATLLFWSRYDRYEPAGSALLSSPCLAEAFRSRGQVSESDGRFRLSVAEPGKWAEVRFRIPEALNDSLIRVRGRISVDGVVPGRYRWRCARLMLVQYDSANKWIPGHHAVVAERGTKGWAAHEDVFEIAPESAFVEVGLQQMGTEGTAWFEQIEARPVRVKSSYAWWRLVFAGAWLVAAVYYFPRCRLHRRKLKILVLLNVLAILAGALMPGEWIEAGADRVRQTWVKLASPPEGASPAPPQVKPARDKASDAGPMDRFTGMINDTHRAGHFALFASLCFLVYLSAALERQQPTYFLKVGFDILLFAAVTEALQCLTLDRSAGVRDLLVDVCGMVAAFVLFLAVLPLVRRIESKTGSGFDLVADGS